MILNKLPLFDIDAYEYIPRQAIADGLLTFLKYTDEKELLAKAISRIIKRLKPTSILDVGAGEGCFLQKLCKYVDYYVALEPNVHLFRQLCWVAEPHCDKVQLHRDILEEFNTTDRFDLILSCHTLSYFRLKREALGKMAALVTPRGIILLILHSVRSEQLNKCSQVLSDGWKRPHHLLAEDFIRILQEHGYHPKLSFVNSSTCIPNLQEWHRLSYFFTRHHYEQQTDQGKIQIDNFFLKHAQANGLEIKATHGLIVFSPNTKRGAKIE